MKRVIKDFKKLPEDVKDSIKEKYSEGGLVHDIITIRNTKGTEEVVLPFNTIDIAYLVRLPDEDIEDMDIDEEFTGDDLFDD